MTMTMGRGRGRGPGWSRSRSRSQPEFFWSWSRSWKFQKMDGSGNPAIILDFVPQTKKTYKKIDLLSLKKCTGIFFYT